MMWLVKDKKRTRELAPAAPPSILSYLSSYLYHTYRRHIYFDLTLSAPSSSSAHMHHPWIEPKMASHGEEDLVATTTTGFKVGEKKTLAEYTKLGEIGFVSFCSDNFGMGHVLSERLSHNLCVQWLFESDFVFLLCHFPLRVTRGSPPLPFSQWNDSNCQKEELPGLFEGVLLLLFAAI